MKTLNYFKENVNESKNDKIYNNKQDVLTAFFKNEIKADELETIADEQFGTQIATKEELSAFLTNKFLQSVMSDTYDISVDVLVKKVKELIKHIK